jgi:uncharacterized protein (TIGR03083 family)
LRANDLRFIEVARSLSRQDWSRPSLCSQWSNHEVLAHLVIGYRISPGAIAVDTLRHRGSFDRSNAAQAKSVAAHYAPSGLIEEFAALIDRPRGVGRIFPRRLLLGDHVLHELDIILPLGLHPGVDPGVIAAILETQVRVPNPLVPAAARARGLTLRATDVDWTSEQGSRCVTGKAVHLASALGGRRWALDKLSGDGVAELRDRM